MRSQELKLIDEILSMCSTCELWIALRNWRVYARREVVQVPHAAKLQALGLNPHDVLFVDGDSNHRVGSVLAVGGHNILNSTLFRRYNAVIVYLERRRYVLIKSKATALIA